ncbi:MAG TPA: hypothetical protein VEY33_01460 [Gemmatimonadota bacterium]|nr:hypothetical protein [Gemmatimonadota bacterium]
MDALLDELGADLHEEDTMTSNLTTAERAALRYDLESRLDAALQRAGLDPTSAAVRAVRDRYALDVREDGAVTAQLNLGLDRPVEALADRIVAELGWFSSLPILDYPDFEPLLFDFSELPLFDFSELPLMDWERGDQHRP